MKNADPASPRPPDALRRTLWPAVAALVAVFLLTEFTTFDLWVQDACFNAASGTWRVDDEAAVPKLVFYTGPKAVLIAFGVSCIVLLFAPTGWRRRFGLANRRPQLAAVIATLAIGPVLIGWGKATTNMFCPYEITRYGGDMPYIRLIDPVPPEVSAKRKGRCFPAGHASGGFALLALAGLASTRRGRLRGVAVGLAFGSWMGVYQMLKGAHYLSHTLLTILVVWMVFLALRSALNRWWHPAPDPAPHPSAG